MKATILTIRQLSWAFWPVRQPLLVPLAALASGVFAARLADVTFSETVLATAGLTVLALVELRFASIPLGLAATLCTFAFAGLTLGSISPSAYESRIDAGRQGG